MNKYFIRWKTYFAIVDQKQNQKLKIKIKFFRNFYFLTKKSYSLLNDRQNNNNTNKQRNEKMENKQNILSE